MEGPGQKLIHRVDGTPLIPPTALTSPSQLQLLVPRRILSSTPSGENGENVNRRDALIRNIDEKRKILMDQNRKILHPPPIEGIDVGVTEGLETLDPEIKDSYRRRFCVAPCIGKCVR